MAVGFAGGVKSTCSNGASVALPSRVYAVRSPIPLMTMARAFPLAQPGRLTTSWITAVRSGVRCAAVAAPTVGHDAGCQVAVAVVRGRLEMLSDPVAKVAGLSAACPRMYR